MVCRLVSDMYVLEFYCWHFWNVPKYFHERGFDNYLIFALTRGLPRTAMWQLIEVDKLVRHQIKTVLYVFCFAVTFFKSCKEILNWNIWFGSMNLQRFKVILFLSLLLSLFKPSVILLIPSIMDMLSPNMTQIRVTTAW